MRRRRAAWALGSVLGLWVALAVGLDLAGRWAQPPAHADAIIVAGCRVYPDGRPSPGLARRTRRGVALWRAGVAPVLILTGGRGAGPRAEAVAAAELAHSLGVPAAALVLEDRSTSTEGNAANAARLYPARSVVVVTDSYHVFRCRRVFARWFPEVGAAGAPGRPWEILRGALREVPAVAWYAVCGRLRRPAPAAPAGWQRAAGASP